MWKYPVIDPVAVSLGPIQVHWYGLMYVAGLGAAWWLMRMRERAAGNWSAKQIDDLVFYGAIGVIAGGRIGYMIFYGYDQLLESPLNLLKVWQGGMSYHGGMLGVFAAMLLFARKEGRSFFEVTDLIAPYVPPGLCFGRIGNFINTELPGRPSDLPWAIIWPGEAFARHPSSLYQALLEGPVLFAILWWYAARKRPTMSVSGVFMISYGCLRLFTEMFREPDPQIGFIAFGWLTMGQLLSVPMVLVGIILLRYAAVKSR